MAVTEGWVRRDSYNDYNKTRTFLRAWVTCSRGWNYSNFTYSYRWRLDLHGEDGVVTVASGRAKTQKMCCQCADAMMDWILQTGRRCEAGCHIYVDLPQDLVFPGYPSKAPAACPSEIFCSGRWVSIAPEPRGEEGTLVCLSSVEALRPDGAIIDLRTGQPVHRRQSKRQKDPEEADEKRLPPLREWEN